MGKRTGVNFSGSALEQRSYYQKKFSPKAGATAGSTSPKENQ